VKRTVRKSAVTATDIARETGLSPSTVSIVLRGLAGRRKIPPQTVERVQDAARRLNYVPNQWARNLRQQRSGMIGVVLASFRWDWAQELVGGMLGVLEPQGYTLFVAVHLYHPDRARRELLACLQRRDEAIITVPLPGLDDVYLQAERMGMPLIFIGDRPANLPKAHFVAWNSPQDTRTAIGHLIDIGRKRIGFVGFDYPMPLNVARYEAYRSVLKEAGLRINERWVVRASMMLSPDEIIEQSLEQVFGPGQAFPNALFVQHDGLAVVLLDALRGKGIRVPDDVALIGLGDYPVSRHAGIGLSTMREPIAEIGRESAEAAMSLIAKPNQKPIQHLLPCGQLSVRQTTVSASRMG
jgi:DNA-binding LacI/PurR family transcriptional regulator